MVINRRALAVDGLDSPSEWFLMGYFISNGWLLDDDITIGLNITDTTIFKRIQKVSDLDLHDGSNQYKYIMRNTKWYGILEKLHDTIPEWIHNAPVELLEHFIDGVGVHVWDNLELSLHLERIYLKLDNNNSVSAYIDGDYAWFPIESIDHYESNGEPVYNFEIVIDNSYIVENRVVNNCQVLKN